MTERLAKPNASSRQQAMAFANRCSPPQPNQPRRSNKRSQEEEDQKRGEYRKVKRTGRSQLGERRDQHVENGHERYAQQRHFGPVTHPCSLMPPRRFRHLIRAAGITFELQCRFPAEYPSHVERSSSAQRKRLAPISVIARFQADKPRLALRREALRAIFMFDNGD